MSPAGPPIEKIKEGMRSAWMAGDFGMIAKMLSADADSLVARLGILPAMKALDVACGSGNVTLPIARLGAVTTGVDIAPNLLVQARERASAEGLTIQFDEGDAEHLPYEDGSFDLVTTMFGAMFAPRPDLVAAELARVLRPGGRLAMANWNPQSFTGDMFRVGAKHAPPPPNVPAPVLWGDAEIVRERLAGGFVDIRTELIPLDFDLPTDAAGAVNFFRQFFGPTNVAFSRLDEAGQAAFAADLEELWSSANVADDPANRMLVRNEYLQVLAVRA